MRRGDVWWVNFDPSVGTEVKKLRPAVVVSNNSSNLHLNRAQVVPLTSNVDKCFPCEALVTLNGAENKAMADQLATVDKRRFQNKAGELSSKDLKLVEHAIKIQLGLPL